MDRRAQLAGAGAAALDRPGQVALVGDHLPDVGPQREAVDRDLLGRAPDEDEAGPAGHRADDRQVQVGAAEGVGRREAPRRQGVGDDHPVEVGPVAERQRQAVRAVEAPQLLHVVLVHQDVVRPQEPVAETRPPLGGAVVVGGGHLVEVALDLRPDLLLGATLLVGRGGDGALEALVVEQLGDLLRRRGGEALPHAPGQGGTGEVPDTTDGGHGPSFPPGLGASTGVRRKLPSYAAAGHGCTMTGTDWWPTGGPAGGPSPVSDSRVPSGNVRRGGVSERPKVHHSK